MKKKLTQSTHDTTKDAACTLYIYINGWSNKQVSSAAVQKRGLIATCLVALSQIRCILR